MPRPRAAPSKLLADAVVALRLHALLPASTKKAVTRLRHSGAARDRVLAQAINAVSPPEAVQLLLAANGIEATGDWKGVFFAAKRTLDVIDDLLARLGLGDDPVGVGLVWRLAFFELAVRIGAASFARAPDATPVLRHDLWREADGFGLYLLQVAADYSIKRPRLVAIWIERARAGGNVEKSQLERWLYEGRTPQARHVEPLARAIAIAAGRDNPELVTTLRLRFHLFLGCQQGYRVAAKLLGDQRASTLAATFAKQVHRSVAAFSKSAGNPPDGPRGPIDPAEWLRERRMFARKAAVFGFAPGSPGADLLRDTNDPDLGALVWPPTSLFLAPLDEPWAQALDAFDPGVVDVQHRIVRVVRHLSLDDVVADASQCGRKRGQPLGWLGLIEGVPGSWLSD